MWLPSEQLQKLYCSLCSSREPARLNDEPTENLTWTYTNEMSWITYVWSAYWDNDNIIVESDS